VSELRELRARWFRAWLDKDAATVEPLMATDFLYVASVGLVLDRPPVLATIRPQLPTGLRHAYRGRGPDDGPDAAVVRHRDQRTGSFEGTLFTGDHRCVMVWEKRAPVATRDGAVLLHQHGDARGSTGLRPSSRASTLSLFPQWL
jgi:hypothetical protein